MTASSQKKNKKAFLIKVIVFTAGAVIMSLEIFGLGIIAPYFGKSLIVSSVLIAVIFLALSVGYFVGGIVADRQSGVGAEKHALNGTLAKTLLSAGLFVGIVFIFRDFAGSYLRWHIATVAMGTFLLAAPIFIPINLLLGAVLPLSIRLYHSSSSQKISTLYTLSTLGSIAGTLLTGYVLVPYTNIAAALALMATLLLILAALLSPRLCFFLLLAPFLFYFEEAGTKNIYTPPQGENVLTDGSIIIDPAKMKKLDEGFNQYGRTEVFETTDGASGKPIRLFRVNRELHSVSFLDSNELVLNYAKYNRLGGHFNPGAKKALLIGGGGYSYSKYFLGDTPLFDREKHWKLDGKNYSNINTVTVPVLITSNPRKLGQNAILTFIGTTTPTESEREGEKNKIIARNQRPGINAVAAHVEMSDTGMFGNEGFVHVHEVNKDGDMGKVVSGNISINVPHEIIGHSDLFTGTRENIQVPLNRKSKDGETLYLMLHRDNGNKRFDQLLVDGYEKIEKLDVVEIDPNATKFAQQYFDLRTDDPRLRIFEEDARTYLNRTKEKYDIIYIDAFQSFYSVPFELTTLESYEKIFGALNDGGVVVANFPHTISGKFFQSEWRTLKKVFPAVRVYAVDAPNDPDAVQNIVVIAFKTGAVRATPNFDDEINKALTHEWVGEPNPNAPIFTDDYAPTEYLIKDFINMPTM
jgi:MFS family permease